LAIAEFRKIRVVGYRTCRDDVLGELQSTGVMEIAEVLEEDVSDLEISEDVQEKINRVEFCLKSFSPFRKKGIMENFLPAKVEVDSEEYRDTPGKFDLEGVYEGCRDRERKLRELNAEEGRLRNKFQELSPWRKLTATFEELNGTEAVELLPVKIPRRSFALLREEIEKTGALEIVDEKKSAVYCLIMVFRKERDYIDGLSGEFQIVRLPEVDTDEFRKTPEKILRKISGRLEKIEGEREVLRKETEKASSADRSVLILRDHLCNLREKENVLKELKVTQSVFILEGWVKEKDLRVIKRIEKKFPEIHVETRTPAEREMPPVDFENKKLVQPFEVVTSLYGMPYHREMDPTPLLAPFFAFFFALCLTDAGYGLLLAALAFFCLKKLKLEKGGRQLLNLLFVAGIMTIIVGVFTGGMFGFQFENVPENLKFLKTFRDSLMIVDPMKEFLVLLLFCLGLGFVQVWFGFLVKMFVGLKQRKAKEAVFSQVPWLMLLLGLVLTGLIKSPEIVLLGLVKESPLGGLWVPAAKVLLIAGVCGMFVQPGSGNVLKRLGIGLYSLYGIIGCFGDILSYVRLFALGLATLAMAVAINTMAGMVMGMSKFGIILAIPIFVGGHLFNMAINVLSGFIHTVRLQFVEFFTKFYQGGGRTFRPFAIENRYVEIVSGELTRGK